MTWLLPVKNVASRLWCILFKKRCKSLINMCFFADNNLIFKVYSRVWLPDEQSTGQENSSNKNENGITNFEGKISLLPNNFEN